MKQSLPAMVLAAAMLSLSNGPATPSADQGGDRWTESKARIAVNYTNPSIDASIENAPLGDVLRTLAEKTPFRYSLPYADLADEPISAVVTGASLVDGVKQILKGFSYTIDARHEPIHFTVLSTRPSQVVQQQRLQRISVSHSSSAIAVAPLESEGVPEMDPSATLEDEHEVILRGALGAMNSQDVNQRIDAVKRLASIDDPRAVQSLIEAATHRGTQSDAQLRLAATDALAQTAVDRDFSDRLIVAALERLAGDTELSVSTAAQEALKHRGPYWQQSLSEYAN